MKIKTEVGAPYALVTRQDICGYTVEIGLITVSPQPSCQETLEGEDRY